MNFTDSAEEQAQREKREAEQIVASMPLIPEVERIDVELYTDNTGDPAFQLIFQVKPNVSIDKSFIKRFNQFAGTIQNGILHSPIHRFPYTRLRQLA